MIVLKNGNRYMITSLTAPFQSDAIIYKNGKFNILENIRVNSEVREGFVPTTEIPNSIKLFLMKNIFEYYGGVIFKIIRTLLNTEG